MLQKKLLSTNLSPIDNPLFLLTVGILGSTTAALTALFLPIYQEQSFLLYSIFVLLVSILDAFIMLKGGHYRENGLSEYHLASILFACFGFPAFFNTIISCWKEAYGWNCLLAISLLIPGILATFLGKVHHNFIYKSCGCLSLIVNLNYWMETYKDTSLSSVTTQWYIASACILCLVIPPMIEIFKPQTENK